MDVASPSEPTLEVRVTWVRGTPSTMALPSAVLEIDAIVVDGHSIGKIEGLRYE